MKRILPLVLVAGLTFFLVWLFLEQAKDQPDQLRNGQNPFEVVARDPAPDRARDPKDFDGVVTRTERMDADKREEGQGALRIHAILPNGQTPEGIRVVTQPALSAWRPIETGLQCDGVQVGSYQVSLVGDDIVPVVQRAVKIQEGGITELTFKVVRGVRPRGVVLNADGEAPVAGARIDFNGLARVVSGPDGRFEVPSFLPRIALDVVDVRADDFDFQKYRGKIFPDPGDMRLYVGGSKGLLLGQIHNVSGQAIPDNAVVRLTLPPLYDLRREISLNGQSTFRMENLYPGLFRIELHFPDGEFPMVAQLVEVPSWQPERLPEVSVQLVLEAGLGLSGRLKGEPSHLLGVVFELRNRQAQVVATAEIDEQFRYEFKNLAQDSYYPVLKLGGTELPLPVLEVSGNAPMTADVDVAHSRWER